jgi:hypothetical protein
MLHRAGRYVRAGGGKGSGCARDGRRQGGGKPGQDANQAADVMDTLHVDSTPFETFVLVQRRQAAG